MEQNYVTVTRCIAGFKRRTVHGSSGPRTFENELYPITLATQDRTLIDQGLQNGCLFTIFVYINCRKYYNKGFDSKLTPKMLYCESITKSKN